MQFNVLASGSTGNASFLRVAGFGLLLDFGLPPRSLAGRLDKIGAAWDDVHAVLLSHIHTDHWNLQTLQHLLERRIVLHCHASHYQVLEREASFMGDLHQAGLVRLFTLGEFWQLALEMRVKAFPVSHDSGLTCGFRFEGPADIFGNRPALGWLTDLGTWSNEIAALLADVDILGLEFNHDVGMQIASGRPQFLIRRVLGDFGHLSNEQAVELLAEILNRSQPGRLRHLIQLHLSQQCNQPRLARQAVLQRWPEASFAIHAAGPQHPGPSLAVGLVAAGKAKRALASRQAVVSADQPLLPGWEDC